eukprot:TRINITY_DN2323_c0_g1_i2.p1 TRINITY_DN2323_c0_g1~~TRINITY_DN2323_c0_g1_i2.p1  ORF type:complete len:350 (+),score=63.17 TRINITY_DN2323_c0_g1_i2:160-1209(+)
MKSFWSHWLSSLVALPAEEEALRGSSSPVVEQSRDGTNPFDQLPFEIMLHIASNLSSKQLCKFGMVCRRWLEVSKDQKLWKDLCCNELRLSFILDHQTESNYIGADWKLLFIRLQRDPKEFEPTYHDTERKILGCIHYQRSFKIKPVCCGQWTTCRLCHDHQNNHVMDRFATQEIFCMRCKTIQPVGRHCQSQQCRDERPVRHFCPICKLWEDNERKEIYHCANCGICRLGKQSSYVHCFRCNMCVHKYIYNTHNCKSGQTKQQCPVCNSSGPLWNSLQPIVFLPCGDAMHSNCAQQLIERNSPCPVCNMSIQELLHLQHMQQHHQHPPPQQQQQQPPPQPPQPPQDQQ